MNEPACCPIVELRQYTLHPGQREVLIELFEREFIESQEVLGMKVIGTFRDLEKPDRFVWLRGFPDMESRATQLGEFYGGPVWKAHREVANSTMIDSDNVLLLRPVSPDDGFALESLKRAPRGAAPIPSPLLVATIYHLEAKTEEDFASFFAGATDNTGIDPLATFVTEHRLNTFPNLPVRDDNVFVWFAQFKDRVAYEDFAANSGQEMAAKAADRIKGRPEILLLAPTARSLLGAN